MTGAEALPTIWPFMTPPEMPAENAWAIHLLLSLHTALTALVFASGPVMAWRAWKDRADWIYWGIASLPLGVEAQRLVAGNRCVVQDLAQALWQVPPDVWAPDLYGVHASWMTYVVDACIASYAAGLIVSVALFLKRRRGWFGGHAARPNLTLPR
ncbi:hypothetical protein [Parvularcula lutaonensis]|uniref:DUF2784 domain-containing protein n=1 Tax=Parvularcula lutaonensis TaxID=491923 RepID=A0ABV7MBR1_9PROT|nr:hypothetical protein [Parvularcula lutaonensis]